MFWGYSNLARHLSLDQPCMLSNPRHGWLEERPTIEEIAADYVADLRAFQPHGLTCSAVIASGQCRLRNGLPAPRQGEQTVFLALINCAPPNTAYEKRNLFFPPLDGEISPQFRFLVEWFLLRWKPATARVHPLEISPAWPENGEVCRFEQTDPMQCQVDQLIDLEAFAGKRRRLWETHVRALIFHQPRPMRAGHVVSHGGHSLFCSFDERYGWGNSPDKASPWKSCAASTPASSRSRTCRRSRQNSSAACSTLIWIQRKGKTCLKI